MASGTVVERAYTALGFGRFDDYLAKRSGKTLVEMAAELGVNERTFIVYHSRWIDEQAKAGKVGPLRLED